MPTNPVTADFYIKQHDRLPGIVATLSDANGVVVDLTGCTVLFKMRPENDSSATPLSASASIASDPTTGIVTYFWNSGDTDVAGIFYAEWEVTFANSKKGIVPK